MGALEMETERKDHGIDGPVTFAGSAPDLDDFVVRVVDAPFNQGVTSGALAADFGDVIGKTYFVGLRVFKDAVWRAKDFIMQSITTYSSELVKRNNWSNSGDFPDPSYVLRLGNTVMTDSNFYAVQKIFENEFQFDVFFESASARHNLESSVLDKGIPALVTSYDQRFETVFPTPPYVPLTSDQLALKRFSKAITANLMGGVGYFYGTSLVDRDFSDKEDELPVTMGGSQNLVEATPTEPRALLTATPSRSFFPRGFYW
jgi:mannosyl-oligosaccharide glucosidase